MIFAFLIDGQELDLPVTPGSYRWGAAQTVNEVSVDAVGTVYLPGRPAAHSDSVECLLPAKEYPFLTPGAMTNPMYYIEQLEALAKSGKVARYIAGDRVNAQVLVEEIVYEERDGTGDVYATIYLKEYLDLEAVTTERSAVNADTGNYNRPAATEGTTQYYTVKTGDCLSVICRRFYGNGTAKYYNAVAKYNGIKNPHLIYSGQRLTLPPASQLGVA